MIGFEIYFEDRVSDEGHVDSLRAGAQHKRNKGRLPKQ